jgi:hypothetical protein
MKLITQDLYNKLKQSLSHDLKSMYDDVPGFILLTVWQCYELEDELCIRGCLEVFQDGGYVVVRAVIKQGDDRIVAQVDKMFTESRLNASILSAMKTLDYFRHPGSYGGFDENKFMPKAIVEDVIQSLVDALKDKGYSARKQGEHTTLVEVTGLAGLYPQVRIEDDYGTARVRVWPAIITQDSIANGARPGLPLNVNVSSSDNLAEEVDKIAKAVGVLMPDVSFVSTICATKH